MSRGRSNNPHLLKVLSAIDEDDTLIEQDPPTLELTGMVSDLVRFNFLFVNSTIIILLQSIALFNYYMLSLQIKYTAGDIFQNIIWAGVSDMSAIYISGLLYNVAGVKKSLIIIFSVQLVAGLSYEYLYGYFYWLNVIMLAAKYGGANAACSIIIYSLDALFPSILISTVFGISNVVGRTVTILAP